MKKTFRILVSLLLCVCLMTPTLAFAAETETAYNSVADYVADMKKETVFSRAVNGISNFFLNDFLGTALKLIIPDSDAVADYEKFDIDEYDNFYAGMETFIDEPQGEKVWSLGYGKASVLPEDFGVKEYAKNFGNFTMINVSDASTHAYNTYNKI